VAHEAEVDVRLVRFSPHISPVSCRGQTMAESKLDRFIKSTRASEQLSLYVALAKSSTSEPASFIVSSFPFLSFPTGHFFCTIADRSLPGPGLLLSRCAPFRQALLWPIGLYSPRARLPIRRPGSESVIVDFAFVFHACRSHSLRSAISVRPPLSPLHPPCSHIPHAQAKTA
jgi:hypothetical protein